MINTYITQAEEKWLKILAHHCEDLFKKKIIPSHDHSHHLRVWKFAKEIMKAIHQEMKINYELIEASLIAAMFHDTGLSITLDENHGKESRKLCEQYFKENNIEKPVLFEELLEAIELHDNKNYTQNISEPASLLSIICNADDLDAFGKIGVIRYTDIYFLRDIPINGLADSVIQNLDKRFSNFERNYQTFRALYNKHKDRYLVCRNFFEETKDELASDSGN